MKIDVDRAPQAIVKAANKPSHELSETERFLLTFCAPARAREDLRTLVVPDPGVRLTTDILARSLINFEYQLGDFMLSGNDKADYERRMKFLRNSRNHLKYTGLDCIRFMAFMHACRYNGVPTSAFKGIEPVDLDDHIINRILDLYSPKKPKRLESFPVLYGYYIPSDDPPGSRTYVFESEPPVEAKSKEFKCAHCVLPIDRWINTYLEKYEVEL